MKINPYLSEKLIENCLEGIWVIDEHNKTVFVNQVVEKLLERDAKDFIGKKISDFMRPEEAEDLEKKLEMRQSGMSEFHELRLLSGKGKSVWVSAACSPIMDEENNILGAVGLLAEISDRRKNQLILAAQKSVFEILIRGGSLEHALTELLRPIEDLIDGVYPSVLILDEDEKLLFHGASLHIDPGFHETINGSEIGPRAGSCGTSAYRKELVITEDIETDPRWEGYREIARRYNLRSCWSCPITSGDKKVLGTFALYSKEVRGPTQFELDVVRNISAATALTIEHSHLYEKVRKHNADMSLLAEARKILSRSIEYADVLNNIPELIVSQGYADFSFICIKAEDGIFRTKFIASRKELTQILWPIQNLEFDLSSDIGLSKAMKENIAYYKDISREEIFPYLTAKGQGAPNPLHMKALYDVDLKSYLAIPLTIRNEVIGGMLIGSTLKFRRYRQNDLDLFLEVARSCANAIDNASLYRESKRSVQAREDFISIASHELRTPLTSLKMRIDLLSHMLEKGGLPEEVRSKLKPIISEIQPDVQKFAKLIETLLDISKLGSKNLSLSLERCNIGNIIRDEVKRLKSEFAIHQTPLYDEIQEKLEGECDPVRIQQLVANLLMNALKFGGRKPVEFKVTEEKGILRMEVKDLGIGISDEDQKRIFKPFERAVSDKHFGGLGLGLFITNQIVHGHRGTIEVTSAIGKGTTFIVKLPIHGS